jgi:murein L,D-transpeptidase YcbB/YkuD
VLRVPAGVAASLITLAVGLSVRGWPEEKAGRPVREAVLASARHPWLSRPDFANRAREMRALYGDEPDGLVWFEGDRLHPGAVAAVDAVAAADALGLSPLDYEAPLLAARLEDVRGASPVGEEPTLFDLALSLGLVRLFRDVHHGRVDPRAAGFDFDGHPDDLDIPKLVRAARDDGAAKVVERLEPAYPPYLRLKTALHRWRSLVAGPPLAEAPEVKKLEPGDAYDGVPQLLARLQAFGDLAGEAAATGTRYEGTLVSGVQSLQERHGLTPDGIVGRETFRALNASPASRGEQIALALERFRWLPDFGGADLVVVNIPAFRLFAHEPERGPVLTMRVVVGKAFGHQTPVFRGRMSSLTFRPYWNVPPSIARREIVPHIRRDLGYLAREDMEIVSAIDPNAGPFPASAENLALLERGSRLRVRQRPGPRNALGSVVFSFPNEANVYMHDTPAQQLFARERRDFSHGCIRLEEPLALARWVLRGRSDWTEAKIREAVGREQPTRVPLAEAIEVIVFYATALVDREGRVLFFDDVYGHDARLRETLAGSRP